MITANKDLICAIFSLPEIPSSEFKYIENNRAVYLYSNGCLFPSRLSDGVLSMHAAVPLALRGAYAIKECIKVINWVKENLGPVRVVSRVSKSNKAASVFAIKCGLTRVNIDANYKYYEVI